MKNRQSYIDKIKQWLFADEEEQTVRPAPKAEPKRKRELPPLEPVRMVHHYPETSASKQVKNTEIPVNKRETAANREREPQIPVRKRGGAEKKEKAPEVPARKRGKNLKQPAKSVEKQEAPPLKKDRPSVYSRGPFKAQEIPSPIYGLQLQRERVKRYTEEKAAESAVEQQPIIEKEVPAVTYESFTAGERSYTIKKPASENISAAVEPELQAVTSRRRGKTASSENKNEFPARKQTSEEPSIDTKMQEKQNAEKLAAWKKQQEMKFRKEPRTEEFRTEEIKLENFQGEDAAEISRETIIDTAAEESPQAESLSAWEEQQTVKVSEEPSAEESTRTEEILVQTLPAEETAEISREIIIDTANEEEQSFHSITEEKSGPPESGTEKQQAENVTQENTPVQKPRNRKKPADIQMMSAKNTKKKKSSKAKNQQTSEMKLPYNVLMHPADRKKLEQKKQSGSSYSAPGLHLLDVPPRIDNQQDAWAKEMSDKLDQTLAYFRVQAQVVAYTSGPSVTRFEIQPEPGVKINKIVQLTDDLKRSLAATEIRIEAPIPGKTTVGIEVPNPVPTPVVLRAVLRDKNFRDAVSPLTVALGVDISGRAIVTDIASMPHGLIAGTTGSGKSVCVNSMLTSILYKSSPEEVRLLLIDPKVVELAPFNRVPHLAAPVITDAKEATAALKWAVEEMERRYQLFAKAGARDLQRYNKKAEEKLPQLVIVVDELADLMMIAPQEVEEAICRIAQKARACGIHLLVATQRPSVDVITGLIKANIPSRIAFSVSSSADSRTILDSGGAERLLGKGDMLFHPNSSPKPVRIQGTFVTDDEIDRVIDHVAEMEKPAPLFDPEQLKEAAENTSSEDQLFQQALDFVVEKQTASTSLLQRHFQIGYNRAARLIDDMEAQGVVSPAKGSKARDVYSSQIESGM